MCLFCNIASGKIKSEFIYEDNDVVAFNDIDPQAPVHFLVVPKKHIESALFFTEQDEKLVGHMMKVASEVAKKLDCEDGFRMVMNCNELGGQTVFHIHLHCLGKRQLNWPPG